MPFAGFKKSIERASTSVMMKAGMSPSQLRPSSRSIGGVRFMDQTSGPFRLLLPSMRSFRMSLTSFVFITGHVERTTDRDYEIEERRYRTMEEAANRLQKEAKGYLDSLRGEHALLRA